MVDTLKIQKSPLLLPMEKLTKYQKIILNKIGVISQLYEIQKVMKKVKSVINRQIAMAFSKVYLLCAGIVALFIPFGLGTDKSKKNQ